jgi:hypothetical protein
MIGYPNVYKGFGGFGGRKSFFDVMGKWRFLGMNGEGLACANRWRSLARLLRERIFSRLKIFKAVSATRKAKDIYDFKQQLVILVAGRAPIC